MNPRPSQIDDYFTPSILSNPLDVAKSGLDGIKKAVSAPLDTAFPTISNDPTGTRSYPKGMSEVNARTIKPPKGGKEPTSGQYLFNLFGNPWSSGDLYDKEQQAAIKAKSGGYIEDRLKWTGYRAAPKEDKERPGWVEA